MAAAIDHLDDLFARARASDGVDLRALAGELKQLVLTDLKRAIDIADRLADLRCDDPSLLVEVLSARAHVLCYATRFDEATTLLDRAADIAQREGHSAALGQVRLTAVQPLARAGRLDDAHKAAHDAREAFSRCGDTIGQGKSLLNLGIVERMLGRPSDALSTFDAALPLLADQPMLRGALSSNRAEALLDLDRFAQARGAFVAARDAFAAAGNTHGAAIVEGNLADLFSREGRLDAALERFEIARERYESCGATADVARLDAESAEAMAALGAHDEAILALSQCLPRLRASGLTREWRRAQFALAWCLLATKHTAPARQVAGELLDNLGDQEPVLRAQCFIALAVLDPSGPDAADHAAKGLDLLDDRPARLAQAHAWLASAALDAGDLKAAGGLLHALESNALTATLTALRAQASHLRGRLLGAMGEPAEAARHLRAAMLEAERIRGAMRADRWRIACGQNWRDAYLDAMSAALNVGDHDAAFDALERVRGRSLLESLGSHAHRGPDTGELREHLDALNIYYARLDKGQDSPHIAARIAQLEDTIERLRTRSDALVGTPGVSGEPLPLQTVLERVPAHAAVLEYFIENNLVGVFVVRAGVVRVFRHLAPTSMVDKALARVRFAIEEAGDGPTSLWDSAVGELSRALILPVLEHLDGVGTLAMSYPASLERVPWQALPVGGAVLVERFDLLTTPSVTAAVLHHRTPAHAATVAIGVPDDLAPDMEAEAHAVARATGGRAITGPAATAAGALEAIAHAGVVHLATHCVFSPRHPMASRLKLADRWLSAHELASAVAPGVRVVLAGCETGRAGGVNTEDRTGLVSALLASGAAEVLSARWPLHDRTARNLFEAMYGFAASTPPEGFTLARALCHAQRRAFQEGVSPQRVLALHVTGGLP